jgi:hypothetical protein
MKGNIEHLAELVVSKSSMKIEIMSPPVVFSCKISMPKVMQ